MIYDFTEKLVVVTGASAGIGAEVCKQFIETGAKVAALDISDKVNELTKEFGVDNIFPYKCDVSNQQNITDVIGQIITKFKHIDILVNNAGIVALNKVELLSTSDWQKTIDVNLSGAFYVAQAVGKEMLKKKNGKIINIASQAGVVGIEEHAAYCASKFGVIGFTKVLAIEWAKHNINVNSVSPTVVMTELGKKAWAGDVGEAMKLKIPARRFAEPAEIVAPILFLASDYAQMIHGENLLIDGGYTAQ